MNLLNLKKSLSLSVILFAFIFANNVSASERFLGKKNVSQFIQEMVKKHRFNKKELTQLFAQAKIHNSILKAIARPAEGKPWYQYRPIFVTDKRTQGGIQFWKKNAAALARAEKKYGIPAEVIVAIIGVETRYGKHAGTYPVFDALATLAFAYPPRATFFKSELEHFLIMTREEKMPANKLLGSYAGAMGMPQFISSSFRHYAIDFDGDGKRDLWNNPTDAIGSVANYFKKHHWKTGQAITHPVQVKGDKYKKLLSRELKPKNSYKELIQHGVVFPKMTAVNSKAKLLKFEKRGKPEYWVAWNNFYVITRYNHSALYSMAVHQLSQKIKQGYLKQR